VFWDVIPYRGSDVSEKPADNIDNVHG
jgi:hypothetical protein